MLRLVRSNSIPTSFYWEKKGLFISAGLEGELSEVSRSIWENLAKWAVQPD